MNTGSVLLTGAAGYIGSHTAYAFMPARAVVVLDNLSNSSSDNVPEGAIFIEGDVGDVDLVEALIDKYQINAVIHFAGSIVVPESVENPHAYYLNNTVKSHSLIGVCLRKGIQHFVFSSTAAVYGAPDSAPVSEDDTTKPISPYGASKLMVERILKDVSVAHDFRHISLRYFNVAGADPRGRTGQRGKNATHLIKVAAEAAVGRRPQITIFGNDYETPDGTCIRDYIHVSDLAAAHVAALQYLESGGQSTVLNCGYGRGYSVRDVLAAVERVTGVPLREKVGARRAGDPPALVAASDRIRETLRWSPQHDDIDTIVASAISWEERGSGDQE